MGQSINKSEFEQLIGDIHTHDVNYHTRELYMHSTHTTTCNDDEPGVEYRMATAFIKNLHILNAKSEDNVLVHKHTVGGSWSDGMAIINSIQFSKAPVTILSYAQAHSMGGIILQSGDKRVLMPDCEFMLHYGIVSIEGPSTAVHSYINMNEKCGKRMLQLFAERAIVSSKFFKDKKYSLNKVISYFNKKLKEKSDWFMTADEAVFYGLADGILGDTGFETIEKVRVCKKFKGFNRANYSK